MKRGPFVAAAVGVAAFALFVATLAPGLIALGDTPKFQFVGKVLGTAHNPGYPLYVVLSHVFGWLPIGNLAWRINLMSAVFAALTVVLCQLTITELGLSPLLGAAAGLGLATGAAFWSTATFAEVYALHGFLVAAMTYSLVRWRRVGSHRWFFLAIGCFSLGLGHHTSIVLVGPAVAIFAIATAPRFALSPRTVAAILGLFALGFSQYLFVLMRTRQGAWGESPASNLHELWGVIRGVQWTAALRPMSLETAEGTGPMVLRQLLSELSLPVAIGAFGGVVALAIRDRALLALTLGSAAGVMTFAVLFPGQTAYFLVPAYFLLWILAAIGVSALAGALPWLGARGQLGVALAPLLAVVIWHGSKNLEANDLSHRRFDMRYFAALTRQLPARSALMTEDWLVDRMVLYQKFSDPVFTARDLVSQVRLTPDGVEEFKAGGYQLFAFSKAASLLRAQGFDFDHAMWPMKYGSIRQFVTDQPSGTLMAVAVPATRFATAVSQDALPLVEIGGHVPEQSWSNLVAIGIVGGSGALQFETAASTPNSVAANRGLPIGTSGVRSLTDVTAEAVYDHARIRVGSKEVIGSSWPVVALWSPRGDFLGAFALTPEWDVPMPDSPLSLHRLRAIREWTRIGSAPADITASTTAGHLIVKPVAAAPLVVYAGRQQTLQPKLFDPPLGEPEPKVQEFAGGDAALDLMLRRDAWPEQPVLRRMAHVYRIELAPSSAPRRVAFGGIPDVAVARWAGSEEPPAIYGVDLMGELERIDDRTERLHVARDHHQMFLANGWSAIMGDETGGFSMTTGREAEILLPCRAGACATIDLQLRPAAEPGRFALVVNGTPLVSQPTHDGWNLYRCLVPSAALHVGVNSFVLRVDRPVLLGDVLVTNGEAAVDDARDHRP